MTSLSDDKLSRDCAVVVSSFDGFGDVWEACFTLFFRYWADCPFNVYLISNHKRYDDKRVKALAVGTDAGWATTTRLALEKLKEPYMLYIHEDCLLQGKVATKKILNLLKYLAITEAGCIRLFPEPGPDVSFQNNEGLGIISKNADYRVSLQAALWDVSLFKSLLRDGESGWDMEISGTKRSISLDKSFYSVKKAAINYYFYSAIVKGRWMYDAVKLCKREGIVLNTKDRKINYVFKLKQVFEYIKKTSLGKKIRKIPILGLYLSKLYYKLLSIGRANR